MSITVPKGQEGRGGGAAENMISFVLFRRRGLWDPPACQFCRPVWALLKRVRRLLSCVCPVLAGLLFCVCLRRRMTQAAPIFSFLVVLVVVRTRLATAVVCGVSW